MDIVSVFEKVKDENRTALLEHEAKEVLRNTDISIPSSRMVKSEEDAKKAAREFGFPVVMKLMSNQVMHKTDVGAVVVDLKTEDEVQETYNDFMKRFEGVEIEGILIEKMIKTGVEIIIGTMIDDTFGSVILIGLGGVLVEAIKDVVFRMCPVSKESALSAINEIKAQKILNGFRGSVKVDRNELAELMVRISELAWMYRDYIAEMDINPIICNDEGIFPVDARIILRE